MTWSFSMRKTRSLAAGLWNMLRLPRTSSSQRTAGCVLPSGFSNSCLPLSAIRLLRA